ncbi:hypothetical protein QJQ45_012870 [Haematococcus lacustris]|nr:hypothetical protein QJQ45_012870 [Haematococcus lacustris]
MKRSRVVGQNDEGDIHDIRTSAGTFLARNLDPVLTTVLRYGPTNKYGPHLDGLERVASVLIYLVAPEEGGETAFPHSNGWLHPEMGEPTQGPFSECAKGHVAYKPKRGDALMFFDLKPDYQTPDDDSMHTGCPVVRGVKWNAVKWIHGKPFNEEAYNESLVQRPKFTPDPGGFMLGSDSVGACRLSCSACTVCADSDEECKLENRRKQGFLVFDPAELKLAELGVPAGTILESEWPSRWGFMADPVSGSKANDTLDTFKNAAQCTTSISLNQLPEVRQAVERQRQQGDSVDAFVHNQLLRTPAAACVRLEPKKEFARPMITSHAIGWGSSLEVRQMYTG